MPGWQNPANALASKASAFTGIQVQIPNELVSLAWKLLALAFNMKTLKFRSKLCKQILDREKNTTWRLYDDKDISVNDKLSLVVWETKKEFAKATVISVKETALGKLSEDDFEGHERFSSKEEMYKIYSEYYNCLVNEKTPVKVIKFRINF